MSDFINDWVRCNVCFKGFDQNGGMLTSCGHFFCGRLSCKINIKQGEKLTCPVCKAECGAISLSESLPQDILQFFEEPTDMIQKSIDVLKFHNHQKELARANFEKTQRRIRELEKEVDDLKKQNKALIESSRMIPIIPEAEQTPFKSECFIPGIIAGPSSVQPKKKKLGQQELFQTPARKEEAPNVTPKRTQQMLAKSSDKDQMQPISKLFTPTLASRLQSLTGKKIYSPVQPKG